MRYCQAIYQAFECYHIYYGALKNQRKQKVVMAVAPSTQNPPPPVVRSLVN